jgi:hypothetical protein
MAKRFSLLDIKRMKALSSGTIQGNQAANVPDKTDMRARGNLTNKVSNSSAGVNASQGGH